MKMRKIFWLLFVSVILTSCDCLQHVQGVKLDSDTQLPIDKDKRVVEKILVFKDFYKAGTTALLKNVFRDPLSYKVDTTFIDVNDEDIKNFEFILKNAILKKHIQRKINVDLALLVTIQRKEHYFIISTSNNLIVDLTNHVNYCLNSEELQLKAKEFVKKYNK